MKRILETIKSRGHWRVIIRPTQFVKERVATLAELRDIVPKCSVTLRGWDFPHVGDNRTPIQNGLDWVQQSCDFAHHIELWRLYQSGQFVFYGALLDDWRDNSPWGDPAPANWQAGQSLAIASALYTYTEIYEFAARLALSAVGSDDVVVDATLSGLEDRRLVVDEPRRVPLHGVHVASIREFPSQRLYQRAELTAKPRELALELAIQLFERFGWNASLYSLRDRQAEMIK